MKHVNSQRNSYRKLHLNTSRALKSLTLTVTLLSGCLLVGCGGGGGGGGGGGDNQTSNTSSRTSTFVGAPNTETAEDLPFPFSDGTIFHVDLAGDVVTVTLDSVTDTVIMVTLISAGNMARGEAILDNCNLMCLYPVTITTSDFAPGFGPQVAEVLLLENWRLVARTEAGSDRVTVTLGVQDQTGTVVSSELLEVDGQRLCPWVCVGS